MRLLGFILAAIATAMFSFASPAHAQFEDLGGILEDILGGGQLPGQTPVYGETGIESIPVLIRYDVKTDMSEHMLILSAYAPNDPNGHTKRPKLLGQTHLLLNGLLQPLQVVIAVPEPVTRELTFSRITAEVLDVNGNRILVNEYDRLYRGAEPPEITLISVGQKTAKPPQPTIIGLDEVLGEVEISGKNPTFRGGNLTIQLLENALAGGTSLTIAAEQVISIDNKIPPFVFKMDRAVPETNPNVSLAFKAWISDWAGRKTHIIRNPVPYNGPDIAYKLTLDPLVQGVDTRLGRNLDPNLMAQATISGEALFDARSGMPGEARLKVTLSRAVGAMGENRVLSTQTILLRGFEGRAPFALSTASTNFDPLIPAPLLNLQIVDRNDRVYFDSGDISAKEGPQTVQLYARRY